MGLFNNPLGHAGYGPNVTGTPSTQESNVRAATTAELTAGLLNSVYVSPATLTGSGDGTQTVSFLNGSYSTGTQTFNVLGGTSTGGTQVLNLGNGIGGALSVNIANGASTTNFDLNMASGSGTAGAGTIRLGNNPRVSSIQIGNIAPAAARTTVLLGGDAAVNDELYIMPDNQSAGSQSVNIFGGVATGGTQTFNLFTGAGASSTQAINLGTGTGDKTIRIGQTGDDIAFNEGFRGTTATVAGASPVVNNVWMGQGSFTDVINTTAYGTLVLTNSNITASSVILASVSCVTANSACQIVGITPGAGTVSFEVYNAGSANTADNININFWVMSS